MYLPSDSNILYWNASMIAPTGSLYQGWFCVSHTGTYKTGVTAFFAHLSSLKHHNDLKPNIYM